MTSPADRIYDLARQIIDAIGDAVTEEQKNETLLRLNTIEESVTRVEKLLFRVLRQEATEMATVQDLQTKLQQVQDDVTAQTTVVQSVSTVVNGLQQIIADLRGQLAQAISANDPAAMQAVLDGLSTVETSLASNNQALAEAAVVNTPAQGQ